MLTGLEIAGASIAGKKAFGQVVEELYKAGKDKTQKAFKKWRTTRDLGRLARRARACRMNDYQYRQVFEAFCFYIKQAKTRHLDDKAIHSAAEAAFKDVQINACIKFCNQRINRKIKQVFDKDSLNWPKRRACSETPKILTIFSVCHGKPT